MLTSFVITNVLVLIAVQESRQVSNGHEHFLRIEDLKQEVMAMPGDNVTLPCKFSTDRSMELPMLKISWSKDGKEKWTFSMDTQKDETRLEELSNGNANLPLSHIQREDGGNYTCNIRYRSLEKEVTRTVIVNDPAGHYSTLNSQNDIIVSSLHSTPPSQGVEDPRTHSTPLSQGVEDSRPHSTPTSQGVEDPRTHSTPTSKGVEDPRTHSTPTSKGVEDPRTHSTTPSQGVEDPRTHSTPTPQGVEDPRTHSTPTSQGVEDPRTHSTPTSKGVEDPRTHSTPLSQGVEDSRTHSTPLSQGVEDSRPHSTPTSQRIEDSRPHSTTPSRDVEFPRPPSSRQYVESSPPFTPSSKEATGSLGSPLNTDDEFRTTKITLVTAVLSVSWCLAFLIFYYLPKLN